jgi:ATP-dependent exoDNAse (exonuclease V) beta subunit
MSEGADAAARTRALEPAASFIVRAPAGAGKTELLVQRYLALLATVQAPEAIIAITFTVKAAGEMRARVLAALGEAERGATAASEHARRTLALAAAALAHDKARGWKLAENPARLQIQTIDAVCLRLGRRLPLLARALGDLSIRERPRPLYCAAARMLLEQIEEPEGEQLAILLLHLDGDEGRLLDLIADMLAERDRWLRHVARTESPAVQRAALEGNLAAMVSEALAPLAALTPPWLAEVLPALAARYARALDDAAADSPIRACAALTEMPLPVASALRAWRGLAELLLTAAGEPRRQPRAMHGDAITDADRDAWQELLRRLPASAEWSAQLANVRELPLPAYDEAQWRVCAALLALLPRAAACLKLVFADAGAVDFTEIAHAALRALGEADAPTDLALALDQRIEHLLVDEFQDTSYTQLDLLARLTAGWSAGDGRSLFLVGDPMQSIYRFREAEVALFGRVERHGLGGLVLEPLRLRRNFRAQAGLVEWVNTSFARLFPAADARAVAVEFEPAVAAGVVLQGAAVTVHPQPAGDAGAEARTVLDLVAAAWRENPQASVAILVRAREHLAAILRELRRVGLPFRAVDAEPLARVPAVQDLHALTRALLHLGDRVAWLAVLRAPWCGLTLADLHALAHGREDRSVWEAVVEEGENARLSEDGRRRLSRLKRVLADSLAERGRHGLRGFVEGAWTALGGAACLRGGDDLANAQRYLRLLEALDCGGEPARLEELDEALADLYADPDPSGDERLQLMTIHRAKGLEFDVVIVPSLGRSPGRRGERLLSVVERAAGTTSRLLVAPIAAAGAQDPAGRWLRQVEERADDEEAVRLLYVAATRARHRLHLLGAARADRRTVQPRGDSLLARLWPVVGEHFHTPQTAARDDSAQQPRARALALDDRIRRLPSDWVSPGTPAPRPWHVPEAEPEERPEFAWAGEVARQIGRAVHRALEHIGKDGVQRWRSLGDAGQRARLNGLLRELGMPRSRLVDAVERAHAAVRNTLDDPRGRWLLEHAHADALSEHELSAWIDDRLVSVVLDRTFVDEQGVRWIVDFKTGGHEGGALDEFLDVEVERYRPQLERYARLMRRLEGRPLRVGLYFPLLKAWREWEP